MLEARFAASIERKPRSTKRLAFKVGICLSARMKSSEKIKDAESLPKVLTVREVSEYLRIHPGTIYRLLRAEQIPGFRVGGDWRFDSNAIDRWCSEEEKVAVTARYKGAS
jgi:excisionase family DNA binding protein